MYIYLLMPEKDVALITDSLLTVTLIIVDIPGRMSVTMGSSSWVTKIYFVYQIVILLQLQLGKMYLKNRV